MPPQIPGRFIDLPATPPTGDQVYGFLRRNYEAGNQIGHGLRDVYTETSVPVAHSAELMRPRPFDCFSVARENTAYGDGTVWNYLSDLSQQEFDQSGRAVTSHTRIREPVLSKKGYDENGEPIMLDGPPAVVIGVHGGMRYQRVVLSVAMYPGGDEINAALTEAIRVKRVAGDGMQFLIYDRLADGIHLRQDVSERDLSLIHISEPTRPY